MLFWQRKAAAHLLFTLLLAAGQATAQISQVNGTIRGSITDPSGSQVPNATIQVTSIDTGFERKVISNERGEYQVPMLPIGTYKIVVSAPGFSSYEQTGITVRLDNASEVNMALTLGSSQQ